MSATFSVMCIEDNAALVDSLERRLQMEPDFGGLHRVRDFTTVTTEAEARRPSLILLDLSLPGGLDGLTLLDDLVQHIPDAKVVIFTGNPSPSVAATAIARGAWGYVSKGVSSARLVAALRVALGGDAIVELEE